MKLIDRFRLPLEAVYAEVFVSDEKEDGHFVQIVCVDPSFEGQNKLTRSRNILKILGEIQKLSHAISVKGFTVSEWQGVKQNFEWIEYTHHH